MMVRDFTIISLSTLAKDGWARGRPRNYCWGMTGTESKNHSENVVRLCMKEPATNGFIIIDFSYSRLQALHENNLDVAAVSELTAQGVDKDVV